MKLIAGLGNPGGKYKNTRHNAGFMILDKIRGGFGFNEFSLNKKFNAEVAEGRFANEKIILAKPQTFMNESGRTAQAILNFYKMQPKDVIVIHDDSDLPLGKIKIKLGGQSGGHNGIKSIIKNLGSENFLRIKIGVRNNRTEKMPLDKFVLQKFGLLESGKVKKSVEVAAEAARDILNEGETKAMSKYN